MRATRSLVEAFGSSDSEVIQCSHAESYSGLARPAVNLGTAVGAVNMAECGHACIANPAFEDQAGSVGQLPSNGCFSYGRSLEVA